MKLRILHCPNVVGGNPTALCEAQRALGADSHSVTMAPNPYGYPVDEDIAAGRGWLGREMARWQMIRRALRDYDVIHYNFGTCLAPSRSRIGGKGWRTPRALLYNMLYAWPLEFWDVRQARRLGKVIAVTFQGDDARLGEVARRYPVHFAHEVDKNYYTAESDSQVRRKIGLFAQYADLIYALNPDLQQVLPPGSRFQGYCSVDAEQWRPVPPLNAPSTRLRIVHAPSDRVVKGTRHIVAAIEQLRREGFDLEFILVEKMSHAEARRIYETADLGIDQMLAGFYGALAVELMALEVPVVCYLRDEDMVQLPAGMRADLPLINASPENLTDVLRSWLGVRRSELREVGVRSRRFVQRWHNPREIAQATLSDYEDVRRRRNVGPNVDREAD